MIINKFLYNIICSFVYFIKIQYQGSAMKCFYFLLLFFFYTSNSFAIEYSCIDKKYNRLSKMNVEDEIISYEDEKGNPLEYSIVENSENILMGIFKGNKDKDPILNYIFIIKNNALIYNSILRSIKDSYNEIYSEDITLKCIGQIE